MSTRTGNFAIGFRRLNVPFLAEIDDAIAWAKDNGFEAMDLPRNGDTEAAKVVDAGLRVGSVDLPEWRGMISANADTRKKAIATNTSFIEACAKVGPMNHFCVMLPENPELPRQENFAFMVESFRELAPVFAAHDAHLVIEGWPGPGATCCTPETYRAFFTEVPSPAMGINYDPSHLMRMGIDPLRFLREFGERVHHVHGKDTQIVAQDIYEYGHEQPATFHPGIGFGSAAWRYTIPGHGRMDWLTAFAILAEAGYQGCVCIELEDANFNGTDPALGLNLGRQFLSGC